MSFLIEWMYDRKNGAQHKEIIKDFYARDKIFRWKYPRGGKAYKIDLAKTVWFHIKPAPKPYMPPVGQIEGSE